MPFVLLWHWSAAAIGVEAVKFNDNAKAWLSRDDSLPLVAVTAVFAPEADAAAKPATATLAAKLLKGGTTELDAEAFGERLEESSIRLSFAADKDTFTISLQSSTANLDNAFELLAQAWQTPVFTQAELAIAQAELATAYARRQQNPPHLASRLWYERAFPAHPYGDDPLADPRAVTIKELVRFASQLRGSAVFVGAAGDVTAERLRSLLAKTFRATPAVKAAVAKVPPRRFKQSVAGELSQSSIVFGLEGLATNDEDYLSLALLNHIVGGGFGSRLVEAIREERGLAYSVGTALEPLAASPLIIGSLQTDKTTASLALRVLQEQLLLVAERGVTAEELADAKAYLSGALPTRLTKLGRIADFLAFSQYLGRPIDYLRRRQRMIESVSLERVNRLAAKIFAKPPSILVLGEAAGENDPQAQADQQPPEPTETPFSALQLPQGLRMESYPLPGAAQ